jgi:EpsI family protein
VDRAQAKVILTAAIVVLAVAGNALRASEREPAPPLGLASLAVEAGGGPYADEPLEPAFLDELRAREVLHRTYAPDSDAPVWVFLGYFDRQKEGSQVHSPRHCYPGSGWSIESEPSWPAPWGGDLHSLVVFDGVERRLVLYWFQMRSRVEPDVLPLKIALTRQALVRGAQDVVFASLSTPADAGLAEAHERLLPFARAVQSEIGRLYRERDESHSNHQ